MPAARGPIAAEEAEGEEHREFPDGGEYFGEWQGGLAKGRGIYVWPSGMYFRYFIEEVTAMRYSPQQQVGRDAQVQRQAPCRMRLCFFE